MRIHLVGEAAEHREQLEAALEVDAELTALPAAAAAGAAFDGAIAPEDVVVSLRFRREGAAPPFRLLHLPGAGLDGVDLEALDPGTAVCNVYEHEIPLAEYAVSCLLDWQIRPDRLRAGFTPESWSERYRNREPHGELFGKTVGIVGFGRIGHAIAERLAPFGVQMIVTSTRATEGPHRVLRPERLDALLEASDFVIIACPLTPATRGMIAAAELASMKPDAVLINVSRGPIVAEEDLYRALAERRIAAAYLDVWYAYPVADTDRPSPTRFPLFDLPNAIRTPHSAAWTRELVERRYAVIADNINRLVTGRELRNLCQRSHAVAEREIS